MPNTTITQWGLDYASSASPVGTLIAPLYWVPVYDSRIDGLIHDSVLPVSAFSACVNVSATTPTGEIIWNVDGVGSRYALSDTDKVFILSGSNTSKASDVLIDNPIQSQQWQINELNGTPLAPHFSATDAYFTPANIKWNTSAAFNATPWDNTPVESGKNKYFRVIDYFPVSADTPDSKLRGMVKCRLAKDIGTVKFNKVALYINKFNASGVESPDEPVFFAECQLKTTMVKTSMGTNGFDEVAIEVQIDLHSISADWNDVFFSTSGDYWSRVPDGLYYPERVGIGSFIDSVLSPQASLHVRRTRAMVNLGITDAPVARFDFNDTNYHQIDISDTGLVHQTFVSDYGSLGLYYQPLDRTIFPDSNGVSLGAEELTKRFGSIYLDAGGINIADIASMDQNYIKAYFADGTGYIEASDNVSMTFNTVSEDPAVSKRSYIEGADIRKRDDSLVNYTFTNETSDDYIIMAGIDESNSQWYSIEEYTSQYGVTHKNILHMVENPESYAWLGTDVKVKIFGRGEIDLNGPVMLDALAYNGESPYSYGAIMTRKVNILMVTGLTTDPNSIIVAANEADLSDNPSTAWYNIVNSIVYAGEYQIVGRIRHSEDLRPLIADTSVIGVPELTIPDGTIVTQTALLYKRLHVGIIGAYKGEEVSESDSYGEGRVSTIYAKDIGTTEDAGGQSRIHRMAMVGLINSGYVNTFGASSSGFDLGYITSDPIVGDEAYPLNGTAYPLTTASHPAYYGLWPKTYMVLGNRQDMLDSLVNEKCLYYDPDASVGKSTIDLICTRFMSMTNTLKFEGAFDILGKYQTNEFGFFPGRVDAATVKTITDWPTSVPMPGIHKTAGSPGVTLGDINTKLDYAFIDQITANSLTLAGTLTVGGIKFAKTTSWSPHYTAISAVPSSYTDGPKSSIITDVISLPMNLTTKNQDNDTNITTVYMHYQFVNNVVTGYLDVSVGKPITDTLTIYPVYSSASSSCQYAVNADTIDASDNMFWNANQPDLTFNLNTGVGVIQFHVGQYVIIRKNSPTPFAEYKQYQGKGINGTNMMYGIVTAFNETTKTITIKVLYYRYWSRSSGSVGSTILTGTPGSIQIVTAMPFLLPPPTRRITSYPSSDNELWVDTVHSRYSQRVGSLYIPRFTDIGIDIQSTSNTGWNYSTTAETLKQFTFLTINPTAQNSIDLAT